MGIGLPNSKVTIRMTIQFVLLVITSTIILILAISRLKSKHIYSTNFNESRIGLGNCNSKLDICIGTNLTIENSTFKEFKFKHNSICTKNFDVLFDHLNIDPFIDVLHLLQDKKLITICIVHDVYTYRDVYTHINSTFNRIANLYVNNVILIFNAELKLLENFGHVRFNQTHDIIILDWPTTGKNYIVHSVTDTLQSLSMLRKSPSQNDFNSKLQALQSNGIQIIADKRIFGFKDINTNILVLKNAPPKRFKFFNGIKNILF